MVDTVDATSTALLQGGRTLGGVISPQKSQNHPGCPKLRRGRLIPDTHEATSDDKDLMSPIWKSYCGFLGREGGLLLGKPLFFFTDYPFFFRNFVFSRLDTTRHQGGLLRWPRQGHHRRFPKGLACMEL